MLELSRRDLLFSGAGAAAGLALSPVPWKLLDDLAIWTQRPPTPTPRPAGPLAFRFTSCALCPASCGLKARCFGDQPVGFAPVPGHPASDGGICPLGPDGAPPRPPPAPRRPPRARLGREARADRPRRRGGRDLGRPRRRREGPEADLRRRRRAPRPEPLAHLPLARCRDRRPLRHASRGRPGPFARGAREEVRRLSRARRRLLESAPRRLVRRTGPDRRRDARPPRASPRREPPAAARGTARGDPDRGHALQERGPRRPVRPDRPRHRGGFRPRPRARPARREARRRGVPLDAGRQASRTSRRSPPASPLRSSSRRRAFRPASSPRSPATSSQNRPALVLGGDPAVSALSDEAQAAIAVLNLLLGAPFGPLVPRGTRRRAKRTATRSSRPRPRSMRSPTRSVGLLLLDSTVAEGLVPVGAPRALARRGRPRRQPLPLPRRPRREGDLLLPGPAPLEETVELEGPADAPRATLAVAPALLAPPKEVALPEQILREAAQAAGLALPAPAAGGRAAALLAARRGQLFDPAAPSLSPVRDAASADALGELFARGGCWVDDATPEPKGRFALLCEGEAPRLLEAALGAPSAPPVLRASLPREAESAAPPSPLLTKLTRETALFTPPGAAATSRA